MNRPGGNIWIITGPRMAGKTRFCADLAENARKKGLRVKGILCPAIFSGIEKTAIDVIDLETGSRRRLALAKKPSEEGTVIDHWDFNDEVMQWSNDLLGSIHQADLVIVDELGPLEFKFGQGWQKGLQLLDRKEFASAVAVIRPELLTLALESWPTARIMEIPFELNEVENDEFQQQIIKNLP